MEQLALTLRQRWHAAAGLALAGGVLGGLGAQNGGYFTPEWNWATLALALGAAVLLGVRPWRKRPGRADVAFGGGLALLCAWTWISMLWSRDEDGSVLEGQRTLLYAVAALAVVRLVRQRGALPWVVGGLVAITAGLSAYGLATLFFPERFGVYDAIAGNRLSGSIGYWNGLGLATAMGTALAIGIVAHARSPWARAGAGAAAVLATTTLYFTFSRGGWVALGIALLVALTAPGRLKVAGATMLIAAASTATIGLANAQDAVNNNDADIAQASSQGHWLALFVGICALAAAVLGATAGPLARDLRPGPRVLRAANAALALGFVVAIAAVLVAGHGPVRLVHRAVDSFTAAPPSTIVDGSKRLASFNGSYRAEMWDVAAGAVADEPVLGIGAGAYGRTWLAERPIDYFVRDAHNLWLETLAELGPVGLLLLVLALGAPLAVARRAVRVPLGDVALGAYVAFLAHAAIDWDWDLPYLVCSAILLGGCLLAAARPQEEGEGTATTSVPSRRPAGAVVASFLVAAGVAAYMLPGAFAFDAADAALQSGHADAALAPAARAVSWQPWSTRARVELGKAQRRTGDVAAARTTFRRATADDPGSLYAWLELAYIETDPARLAAQLARVRALNPYADLSGFGEAGAAR